jgi:hypothetical protein
MTGREDGPRPRPRRWWLLAAVVFVVVATLNSAGYRFGVGDQAFYLPAIQRHLAPESFPRDRLLIDDQDRLNVFPRAAATLIRATGVSQPAIFASLYLAALFLLFGSARGFGRALGLSSWAQLAFVAALTLKHRVGLTGVNTLEGYAHPRMLAFAVGLTAVVCFLRARPVWAAALVAAASVVHPTTALWFAVWIGVALIASERRARTWLLIAAGTGAAAAAWAIGWGPLSAQAVRMDTAWLGVLVGKDYLFATDWPPTMWAVALLYVAVVGAVFGLRRARGQAHPREGAMVAGLMALAVVFAVTLPLVAQRTAIAVQFQISRVFWMLDVVATAYAVWAMADARLPAGTRAPAPRRAAAVAAIVVCFAVARGVWVTWVEHPGRAPVQWALPQTDWQDAMTWLARTPVQTHVLANPSHAWRYGTSVRVAAGRDVFLEDVKDTAMAMYSRRVAMRVAERIGAIGDFNGLTPESARAIAARFDVDYLVTDQALELPLAYRNATFAIYRIRP